MSRQQLICLTSIAKRTLMTGKSQDLIQKLALAVDQGSASVVITDLGGRIEYVNRRFSEVTGLQQDEVLGQTPRLWQSGQTPMEVYRDMWQTILAGRVWKGELRNRRKSGELFWDAVTISPIRDSAGRIGGFLATQEDVTERKLAEQALEESESRFRKIIDASFDGICIAVEGVLGEVNSGLLRMFGYESADEVIGRRLTDFVAEESLVDVTAWISGSIEGTLELVGKRKDGNRILLEATSRNHSIAGHPGRVTALRDITDRRSLEDQFRQAQKMEAVGRLASGVAHDFNNLLTIIIGYVDLLLLDLGSNDPRRSDLEQVRQAAGTATSLTRQLLAFSRQQVIEPRLVSLESVVSNADKMLKRLIGEDITLTANLQAEPSTIKIDPGQLEQVILNLVVNSRDAMPTGGKLTIETRVMDLDDSYARSHWPAIPGRYAMLAVSDTGTGMDEPTRARIFEPFFTTKEIGKGTGLGLATVYGIVKQNGGFIWVYSEPGQGTTFKIYFPLQAEAAETGPATDVPAAPRGSETILLVEDSAGVRGAVRQILERHGYAVLEATNGKAAMDFAGRRHRIDLLLTDVVMPEMSGRVLAEYYVKTRPETRVLYMSGYTDDAIVRHGILESGIAFLQKPFSAEALARKVREVLDARSKA